MDSRTGNSHYNHQGHLQFQSFIQQTEIEYGIKNCSEAECTEAKNRQRHHFHGTWQQPDHEDLEG